MPLNEPRAAGRRTLRVRGCDFRWGSRTYVMGVVNVTPDSFSGDGVMDTEIAVERAMLHVNRGADLLDVGGESTRPGYERIDAEREIARVVPVIAGIRHRAPDVPISIDTYKPAVARAACDAGADIINCVWLAPEELLEVAAERAAPFIAMHNQHAARYNGDVMGAVCEALREVAARASARGIPADALILDPGIGFGKTAEHNIEVLAQLERLTDLGHPTLLGTSRKSTIGKLTGREPHDRAWGTAATTALAIASGIDMVRVHDVAATCDVVAVSDAIVRGWRPAAWTA